MIFFTLLDVQSIPIKNLEDFMVSENSRAILNVLDMKDFYRENDIKKGDYKVIGANQFDGGKQAYIYFVEYRKKKLYRIDLSDKLTEILFELYRIRKEEAIAGGRGEVVETIFHKNGAPMAQNSVRHIFKKGELTRNPVP